MDPNCTLPVGLYPFLSERHAVVNLARPVGYHTLTECIRKITSFAVRFVHCVRVFVTHSSPLLHFFLHHPAPFFTPLSPSDILFVISKMVDNERVTHLELQVSMSGGDHMSYSCSSHQWRRYTTRGRRRHQARGRRRSPTPSAATGSHGRSTL
ncbi:hypothetical protein EVAR_78167_1 [Eumeta japonica]|uniref:Uncharacterized protein n=1 Tax=Eumeta variegata TaxID=151549 RepID=A0A4C1UYQ3_EUMVA|nr:hypothetical protein EVAR_78167_1 [Eumeta japonica]